MKGKIIYSEKETCPYGKENCLGVIIKEFEPEIFKGDPYYRRESCCTLAIEAKERVDELTDRFKEEEIEIFGKKIKRKVEKSSEERLEEALKKLGCRASSCEYRTGKIKKEGDNFFTHAFSFKKEIREKCGIKYPWGIFKK